MIDTHCHLTYDGLRERVEEVIVSARSAGVTGLVTVATSPEDARLALPLTERFEGVSLAAGLHPHHAGTWTDRAALVEPISELARSGKLVALGEMGLDLHYPDPPLDAQQRAFQWQLELMHDFPHLPGVIHNRQATGLTLAMLRDAGLPGERFVFHCFTGTDAELDAILDFGAMVSFTGIVTFKSAAGLAASAARTPLERVMIETDAPYLTPEPYRKVKPNEPRYVVEVARFLAAGRGMIVSDFVARTDANTARFFNPKPETPTPRRGGSSQPGNP